MLVFVKSIREVDFEMFVDALDLFAPWMFAMYHTKYARLPPVFIQSLYKLPQEHPEIYEHFLKGRFTVQKTMREFSRISDDQAHEQNNKIIKGSGGAMGIFDSRISLAKWMISGPEIARLQTDFDESKHYWNSKSFENRFRKDFRALQKEFKKVGNPFDEEYDTMYTLVAINVMDTASCKSVYTARAVGKEQYQWYKRGIRAR